MRFYEFADAQAQLALIRTIINKTWTVIAQQAEQKKRVAAEYSVQAKLKPRTNKSSKGDSIHIPTPTAPPPKKSNSPRSEAVTPSNF